MNTDTFAYRLKKRREELNYSRKGLAEVSNIPENTIRNLENGKTEFPRADTLFMLSDILDISPQYLLYGGSKMNAYTNSIIKEMAKLNYDQVVVIKNTPFSGIALPKLTLTEEIINELCTTWNNHKLFEGRCNRPYVKETIDKYCQNRAYFKKEFNLE